MLSVSPADRWQCVILVGGLGTRLGDLTRRTPKPLMPIGDRPFLDILIRNAARQGCGEVLLLAGYRAEQIVSRYAAGSPLAAELGIDIEVVVEPALAGTAGALTHAAARLADDFLMMNGDSLFDIDYQSLAALPAAEPWLAKLALRRVPDASRYGVVELQGDRIRSFASQGAVDEARLINGGVYWMRRSMLDRVGLPPCSLEQEVFPALAAEGLLVGSPREGFFLDIGVPESLREGQAVLPVWCDQRWL